LIDIFWPWFGHDCVPDDWVLGTHRKICDFHWYDDRGLAVSAGLQLLKVIQLKSMCASSHFPRILIKNLTINIVLDAGASGVNLFNDFGKPSSQLFLKIACLLKCGTSWRVKAQTVSLSVSLALGKIF